jgi:hypothetical protein
MIAIIKRCKYRWLYSPSRQRKPDPLVPSIELIRAIAEAVDNQSTVWVNGEFVGEHLGGNTAFGFDITAALKHGDDEIIVRVWDETDGIQLRGKQSLHPAGIWYKAVSGIWQTVWVEEVAPTHLADAQLTTAGFNMIRKHVKVEPRRYYAYCDHVGMLMWQDQVACTGKSAAGTALSPKWTRLAPNPSDAIWSDADHAEWMKELKAMMDELHNQPCIVVWVPFNEAWGQHRTVEVGNWVQAYDPTRLVDIASGGNSWPVGQVADNHNYPNPSFPFEQERFNNYVKVIGEFGGHSWVEPGHVWNETKQTWGYGGLPKVKDEYLSRYEKSIGILAGLKAQGVSAGVYTQTTDVEGELNGLMTYDRAVIKIPVAKLAELSQRLGPEIKRCTGPDSLLANVPPRYSAQSGFNVLAALLKSRISQLIKAIIQPDQNEDAVGAVGGSNAIRDEGPENG